MGAPERITRMKWPQKLKGEAGWRGPPLYGYFARLAWSLTGISQAYWNEAVPGVWTVGPVTWLFLKLKIVAVLTMLQTNVS